MSKPVLKIYDANGVEIPIPAIVGKRGPTGLTGPNSVSTTTDSDITGLLKGVDGKVAQALPGTDYATPENISTHNTAADAHTILARKTETMRLLISRTIGAGENVSAITWTQDDAGNALALIDAEISAIVPPNTLSVGSTAYLRTRLNDKFGSTDYQLVSSLSSLIYLSVFRSLRGTSTLRLKQIKDRIFCKTDYLFSDGTAHNAGTYTSVTTFDSTAINKIYIDVSGLTYFPEGTVIEIYGRTA